MPLTPVPVRLIAFIRCAVALSRISNWIPEGLRLEPSLIAELDPMYHLALHAGRQAWRDAVTGGLELKRVGVIFGNIALPTDKASALADEILGDRGKGPRCRP